MKSIVTKVAAGAPVVEGVLEAIDKYQAERPDKASVADALRAVAKRNPFDARRMLAIREKHKRDEGWHPTPRLAPEAPLPKGAEVVRFEPPNFKSEAAGGTGCRECKGLGWVHFRRVSDGREWCETCVACRGDRFTKLAEARRAAARLNDLRKPRSWEE